MTGAMTVDADRAALPAGERERLAALHRLGVLDTPPEAPFERIARLAARLLDAPIALVSLVDAHRQWFKARVGLDACETPREIAFCAHALGTPRELLVVPDAPADARFRDNPLVTGPPFIRFYAGAPILDHEGRALGTVCVIDRRPRAALGATERAALADLADLAAEQLELRVSARHADSVTGLPNRTRLLNEIRPWLHHTREAPGSALVLVEQTDAGHFQRLTRADAGIGDDFVRRGAQLIARALPDGTALYHVGECRFAFLLEDVLNDASQRLLDQLGEQLRRPIECGVLPILPNAGIGVAALIAGRHGDGAEVLRKALGAAEQAREQGAGWALHEPEADVAQQSAFRLLADLPAALGVAGQLHLEYQPRIDLASGAARTVEALLRWEHPTLGLVSPEEFMPLVEQTALMRTLTRWVLTEALAQVAQWRRRGLDLTVAINVCAQDLRDGALQAAIDVALAGSGAEPAAIELEITERSVIADLSRAQAQLAAIRGRGIAVAIDDFGTGHSNLSYLDRIPATAIKVDRSFVTDLESSATQRHIVRNMIALARDLGLRVVAEGIESAAVMQALTAWGCDEGQGFALGRPMRAESLEAWLAARDRVTPAAGRPVPAGPG